MKYMGSKNRIAKEIIPIMMADRQDRPWVEPFVGGGNLIDKVSGERIGSDNNPFVIDALKAIRDNVAELPKNNSEFTETDYKNLSASDYRFKSYAGFAFSYGGRWMGGWCRDAKGGRDYVKEAHNNALKQSPRLKDVNLIHSNYYDLVIPENSLIYCDPPYQNTTDYKSKFNHDEFYEWCRLKATEGHVIFVSEYNAPDDFQCVWQKEICSSLTQNTGSKRAVEKLFRL